MKTKSPSSLKKSDITALKPNTPIRITTKGGNVFDVWRDFTVQSLQNGYIFRGVNLTDVKFYIGCSK